MSERMSFYGVNVPACLSVRDKIDGYCFGYLIGSDSDVPPELMKQIDLHNSVENPSIADAIFSGMIEGSNSLRPGRIENIRGGHPLQLGEGFRDVGTGIRCLEGELVEMGFQGDLD